MQTEDMENSPIRWKRKRAASSPYLGHASSVDSSDQEDAAVSALSSKSFYGATKKKYVTPLERRDISNIRGEDSDVNSSFSIASPAHRSGRSSLQGTPKASPKLPAYKKKTTPKATNNRKTTIPTPESSAKKVNISATDSDSSKEKNNETAENQHVTPQKKTAKKFFRNSSPGKRARRTGISVQITKGVNFKYKPSGVAKRPRSPQKKLLTSNTKMNGKSRTPIKSSSPQRSVIPSTPDTPTRSSQRLQNMVPSIGVSDGKNIQTPNRPLAPSCKTSTPRRSPRKRISTAEEQRSVSDMASLDPSQELYTSNDEEDIDSGVGKPTQDFELKMFESPAKSTPMKSSSRLSTSPDSIMLISELGSESSPHSSKSSKRLFAIFGKGSPSSRSSPRRGGSCSSSPLSTPGGRKSPHPRNALLKKATGSKEQMMLDFGQKRIGATQCEGCGMTYSVAEPEDEATHTKFHQRMLNVLRFPGWKKERVVQEFPDGSRVVMVLPEEKFAAKKLEQIKQIVDEDLGFVVEGRTLRDARTFLYISESKVVGCCVAQVITQAFRVLSEEEAARSQDSSAAAGRGRPWCCSTTPEPARCGISRIWVLASHRRHSIATQLLDCVRYNFIMGCPLSTSDLAFSDPTPAGMGFATKYTGTQTFLVYKNIT